MRCDLYTEFEPSQLSCLSSSVGKGVVATNFSSKVANFSLKNDCFGRVVLLCLSVVLLLLPCLSQHLVE